MSLKLGQGAYGEVSNWCKLLVFSYIEAYPSLIPFLLSPISLSSLSSLLPLPFQPLRSSPSPHSLLFFPLLSPPLPFSPGRVPGVDIQW